MDTCRCVCLFLKIVILLIQCENAISQNHIENIARDTITESSSAYDHYTSDHGVDGDVICKWDANNGFSSRSESNPWWRTNLGTSYNLWQMTLYNRDDAGLDSNNVARIIGFLIYVTSSPEANGGVLTDDKLCYKDTNINASYIYDITCGSPMAGQYVTIILKKEKKTVLNFCELEVYICDNDWYGLNCTKNCSQRNCKDQTASCYADGDCGINQCTDDSYNSSCTTGCIAGWYSGDCTEKCNANCTKCTRNQGNCLSCLKGMYAPEEDCVKRCIDRHCRLPEEECSSNGHCSSDCVDGWFGDKCLQNCYSDNCARCDRHTGKCLVCKDGYFNVSCEPCPIHCGSNTCQMSDGSCFSCEDGYSGMLCDLPCSSNCENNICRREDSTCFSCKAGYAGSFCNVTCSNKCENTICHMEDSTCVSCAAGYTGQFCNKMCSTLCEKNNNQKHVCNMGGDCINCIPGKFGTDCNSTCSSNCLEGVCHREQAMCLQGCVDGFEGPTCNIASKKKTNVLPIVLPIIMAILLAAAVIGGLIFWKRRRKRQTSKTPKAAVNTEELEPVEPAALNPIYETPNETIYSNETTATCIRIGDLWNYLQDKKIDEGFKKEFETFDSGLQYPCTVAKKQGNIQKNRYREIYAYDHSRVILAIDENPLPGETDYMNACYVDGYKTSKKYIASQGVTKQNLDDFWRMIWQENVRIVVMLTRLVEDKEKCVQYWPEEISTTVVYGKIIVKYVDEEIFADYTIRQLEVTKNGGKEKRLVKQFHFTTWPDKGVPRTPVPLVGFLNVVITRKHEPIIVHCSAGIGRTGSFIAIDILIEQGMDTGAVDPAACLQKLRRQRVDMVQTWEQYQLVHECVLEGTVFRKMRIKTESFPQVYTDLLKQNSSTRRTRLEDQFQMIRGMTHAREEKEFKSSRDPKNSRKNRYQNVPALEPHRPILSRLENYENDYINAVFIPSLVDKYDMIITQTPLPNTLVDFYRLMYEQDCHTVVMMDGDTKFDKSVGVYWPVVDKQVQAGSFRIDNITTDVQEDFTIRKFQLCHPKIVDEEPFIITQIVCKFWMKEQPVPMSTDLFLTLLEETEKAQATVANGRLLVHCMNGAERSGIFCLLRNVIGRLKVDHDVGIAPEIIYMRFIREQIVHSMEQFKYCHNVVQAFLQGFDTYANFS